MNQIKIGSPAHKAGMIIGKQYPLSHDTNGLKKGDLVTFTRDDGSICPRFDAEGLDSVDGWTFLDIHDDITIVDTRSLAEKAGLVIDAEYEVIGGYDGSTSNDDYHSFKRGDVVTFMYDDRSDNPKFKRISDGYTQYIHIVDVKPHTATPLQRKGIKVGDKVKVLKDEGPRGIYFKAGEIVIAKADDGTGCTLFEYISRDSRQDTTSDKSYWTDIDNVELYVEPKKTPVEEAGYNIGQKFTVIHNSHGFFNDGVVVTLIRDDGSNVPRFKGPLKGDKGEGEGWVSLKDITPFIESTPAMKVIDTVSVNFNTVLTFNKVLTPAQITAIMAIADKA